jgi:vancomycin resistance protein YoaR
LIDIGNALLARATKGVKDIDTQKVVLKVKTTLPEITSDKLESYGLKELVASGTTNFKGSLTNRVHNITVGAKAISGTLIKPGEVFSTLEKLGEIDASGGYLPELVIKENRTVPEYGGGLCQVSTTLFRAALNSGMEILARSNHKYRVSYYEPPVGMDATIYDPAPDFKFKNNYDSHILVQATVVGTKITFDFYGTKDSRVVEVGKSEIYDIVEPGPPIEVTSDTLAPGERKQLEKAHQGASAKFHYKVSKEGKILQEKDFLSKYVAWPERWLVGITPETPPVSEVPPVATP